MVNTVGEFLEQIKLQHNILAGDPVLSISLSDIEEGMAAYDGEEVSYPDLATILWLYGEKWIDPKKTSKQLLGELSAIEIEKFHQTVYEEIKMACFSSPAQQPVSIKVKPESPWVNSVVVTHWINDDELYEILFAHRKQTVKMEQKTADLLTNKVAPSPIKKSKNTAKHTAKHSAIKPLDTEIHPPYLSKKYFNLKELFAKLNVSVPTNIRTDLAALLEFDLRKIQNLANKNIPELVYYASLFLFGHATIDPLSSDFTYANNSVLTAQKNLASEHAIRIKNYLNYRGDQSNIGDDFVKNEGWKNFFPINPNVLGIVCFENCPALKTLFQQVWQEQHMDFSKKISYVILPVQNPFLYGRILVLKANSQPVLMSKSDTQTVAELINLVDRAKSQSSAFFSSVANAISSSKMQGEFEWAKAGIKDPALRETLTPSQVELYTLNNLLDTEALALFILKFGIHVNPPVSPSNEQLQPLLALLSADATQVLKNVALKLASKNLCIHLDDTDTLEEQLAEIQQIMKQVDYSLREPRPVSTAASMDLNLNWLKLQKAIWTELSVLLGNKLEEKSYLSMLGS